MMKVFFSEKIVKESEYLITDKNVVCREKKILILSEKKFTEIQLSNQDKFVFWGRIFAVIQPDGTYLSIDMTNGGDIVISKIFSEVSIEEVIKKIEGDFIGCLIRGNQDVTIFSDRFNRKDVFYSLTENGFIAGSDLSCMATGSEKIYDQAALANIVSIFATYAPKKHTIYKDIRRLGVGERLVASNNQVAIETLPFTPLKIENYDDNKKEKMEEYANILEDAVKIRSSSSTNWVYLSSGWDSTTLLALLVKNYDSSNVKAVIGKMEYAKRSGNINEFEIERAKKVADYYSVDLEIVPFDYTGQKSVDDLEKLKPFLKENHIYLGSGYNFYLLSDYIRKNSSPNDAVFCGEISDGAHNFGFSQFATILEHPVLDFREYSDKMASYLFGPTFFKSILKRTYSEDAVYKLLRSRLTDHIFEDDRELNEYEKKIKFVASFFLRNRRIPFYGLSNFRNLTEEGMKMYELEMFNTYFKECTENITPETIYSWILHLYNSFHWQGSTVKAVHETALYNNINLSLPYWDVRLQKFLSKMPENWGRGLELRPTKYPLKWMLENKIDYPLHLQVGPHSYLYDVNPNFSHSAEILYGSAFVPLLKDSVRDYPFEKIMNREYFNVDYYKKLTDDYIAGVEVSGQELTDLFALVSLCFVGWY